MDAVPQPDPRRAWRLVAALVVVAVVVVGLALPGAGVALALAFAFTVYRDDRAVRRRVIVLGLGVTAVALLLTALAVTGTTHLDPSVPVVVPPSRRAQP